MKYPVCLLACAALSACVCLAAQQPETKKVQPAPQPVVFHPVFRTNLDPASFEEPAAASRLFKMRETVISKMLAERRKIITTDRRAKELHQQILKLNRELAVLMENKRAVRSLNRELQSVDSKIKSLKLKNKDTKNTKQGNKK